MAIEADGTAERRSAVWARIGLASLRWLRWTIGTMLGGALAGVLAVVPAALVEAAGASPWTLPGYVLIAIMLGPLLLAGAVGAALAQWLLLRSWFGASARWIAVTTGGAAIGFAWSAAMMAMTIRLGASIERLLGGGSYMPFVLWSLLSWPGAVPMALMQRRALALLPRSWITATGLAAVAAVPASVGGAIAAFAISEDLGYVAELPPTWWKTEICIAFGIALGWSIVAVPTGVLVQRRLAAHERCVAAF